MIFNKTSVFYTMLLSPLIVLAESNTTFDIETSEIIEINSGVVTALTCALEVQKTENLNILSNCPLVEVASGYVIFDVSEKKIYSISNKSRKKIYLFELEKAFGGGRIDITGTITDVKNGIPVIDAKEYSLVPKPKAGNFKGCL